MIKCVFERDVRATRFQGYEHFHLMVNVGGFRRVGEFARGIEVVRVLLEEEGRLAVRVMAHLDRVSRIIAAYAINAAHREERT